VYVVPAFGGLGAPWWDPAATATVTGFAFGVTRAPFARAALDSNAHQIADVLDAVRVSVAPFKRLLFDSGPTQNAQLMQFETDTVGVPAEPTSVAELSAIGVAHLAGVSAGLFTLDGLGKMDRGAQVYTPRLGAPDRNRERRAWALAVARARGQAVDQRACEQS
jgi:glycerol kinase